MDANATGRLIAQLRRQRGYTQKELAEKLMVTDKAISRWETGKGLPETSLLGPLGDALGVSVGELLAGELAGEAEREVRADRDGPGALGRARPLFASTVSALLFLVGAALTVSPLFLASQSPVWILGIAIVAAAALHTCAERRGVPAETAARAYGWASILLQCAALVLEILPVGAVMVFATGPDERITRVVSCFSLLPLGYAHFSPMLTGLLTAVALLLGTIVLLRPGKAPGLRRTVFTCSVVAGLLSVAPLLLFGRAGMTAASYAISGSLLLSACLQAAAGRKG